MTQRHPEQAKAPDDHHAAYRAQSRALRYDALVRAEDVDGVLRRWIATAVARYGVQTLDVGAGTGRVTGLLLESGAEVVAVEPAAPMRAVLQQAFPGTIALDGDVRALPCDDGAFDLAVAGWVVGHFRAWNPETWRAELAVAVAELRRVVRPDGAIVVIETLGTGTEAPRISDGHAELLAELENSGFSQVATLRTDYAFADERTAREVMGDFFGERAQAWIDTFGWQRLPECTGVFVTR